MPEQQSRTVSLDNGQGGTIPGKILVTQFSSRERMTRALKVLGVCWLLAGVTVFIPIAHFFLVPGFLIAGPIAGVYRYRALEQIDGIEGECPACGRHVEIAAESGERLPLWKYCPECNGAVRIGDIGLTGSTGGQGGS